MIGWPSVRRIFDAAGWFKTGGFTLMAIKKYRDNDDLTCRKMGVTIFSNNSTKNLWMNTKIAGMGREHSKNKCCENSFSGLVQGTNCRNPCKKNLVGG